MHVEEAGRGLPLVLLHAFPLSGQMWSAQMADLATSFRVIAPDYPGFGKSPPADRLSIDGLADEVHALLTRIGALPCVIGGCSMGGYVSLAFARKYEADLKGLILLDTRADADNDQARQSRQKNIELVREKGSVAIADGMVPRLLAAGADTGRPQLVRSLRKWVEAAPPKAIEQALIALRDRTDQTSLLPKLKVPTLILVGDGDQITPPELAEGMKAKINGAKLVTIQGAGHLTPIEQPAQVSQAIGRFMAERVAKAK